MKIKYVGEAAIRVGDAPLNPGDTIEVDDDTASTLLKNGYWEPAAKPAKKKTKSKKTEKTEEI
jgi:hypothetical protein